MCYNILNMSESLFLVPEPQPLAQIDESVLPTVGDLLSYDAKVSFVVDRHLTVLDSCSAGLTISLAEEVANITRPVLDEATAWIDSDALLVNIYAGVVGPDAYHISGASGWHTDGSRMIRPSAQRPDGTVSVSSALPTLFAFGDIDADSTLARYLKNEPMSVNTNTLTEEGIRLGKLSVVSAMPNIVFGIGGRTLHKGALNRTKASVPRVLIAVDHKNG